MRNEEVTIPNAVVVAQTTMDYSRFGDTEGVYTPTSVTIGYDAPWRQVHALLLLAAERTAGLRREPKPLVLQAALEDFYVKYTLLVCLERQESRPFTLNALHANIQDLFNEHGVQIMSPNYVFDPAAPKVVPKKDWFAAPAAADRRPPTDVTRLPIVAASPDRDGCRRPSLDRLQLQHARLAQHARGKLWRRGRHLDVFDARNRDQTKRSPSASSSSLSASICALEAGRIRCLCLYQTAWDSGMSLWCRRERIRSGSRGDSWLLLRRFQSSG